MSRASSFEKILAAFADAVAEGNFEEAEGWFSAARLNAGRSLESVPDGPRARLSGGRVQPI